MLLHLALCGTGDETQMFVTMSPALYAWAVSPTPAPPFIVVIMNLCHRHPKKKNPGYFPQFLGFGIRKEPQGLWQPIIPSKNQVSRYK